MVDGLIKIGANVNVADSEGTTPLIAATKENMFTSVKALIGKCAFLFWHIIVLSSLNVVLGAPKF